MLYFTAPAFRTVCNMLRCGCCCWLPTFLSSAGPTLSRNSSRLLSEHAGGCQNASCDRNDSGWLKVDPRVFKLLGSHLPSLACVRPGRSGAHLGIKLRSGSLHSSGYVFISAFASSTCCESDRSRFLVHCTGHGRLERTGPDAFRLAMPPRWAPPGLPL